MRISGRSVMGVELPAVRYDDVRFTNTSGYHRTNVHFDKACRCFNDVKRLTVELAEVESSVFRLAEGIRKTQKRANALKNIVIPRFSAQIKSISEALGEKEREEFSRLKVIKKQQTARRASAN